MKVVEAHPDCLVIEDRPWFLWITVPVIAGPSLATALAGQAGDWATTLLVTALGVAIFWALWYFAPFQRFIFNRPEGTFTHEIHRLRQRLIFHRPLAEILHATAEHDCSDESRLDRVTLRTLTGRHALEFGYSSASKASAIKAINDWLSLAKP